MINDNDKMAPTSYTNHGLGLIWFCQKARVQLVQPKGTRVSA